ncbi:PH domain-containing protein [Ningiella sp. W23]|uniref:PH domain-containing protein n=1 Tax=Ningiella sp. W23 TaxID=3023715 RepID=UPI003756A155
MNKDDTSIDESTPVDKNQSIASQGEDDTNSVSAQAVESDWARVSPVAILYFFVKTIFAFGNGLIYALPVAAFNLNTIRENPVPVISGVVALMILVAVASILKYLFYYYRLGDDRVEIRQGVIKKSHLDLPFVKIQNVKIIQPFYYRFSDYSIIELDTAGSARQEANIVAIRLPKAELFKQSIQDTNIALSAKQASENGADSINPDAIDRDRAAYEHNEETTLNTRSIKDLIIHGVTNNRVWIFLGFLAPFYNTISQNIGQVFSAIGLDVASYLNYETQTIWVFMLHILSIVMVIMLLVVLFSIIGSIFVFYDYRLSKRGQRYIRRSGLLSKHEVSMNKSRIQRAVEQQDWLDMLIKRVNVRFEQNTTGPNNAGQANQINNANKLIVPSVTPNEADNLVADVFATGKTLSQIAFFHVNPRLIIRYFLYPCLPFILLFGAIGLANDYSIQGWLGFSGFVLVLLGACVLRWYRWGFAQDANYVYIRKGFFGRDFLVFPIDKIQQTLLLQTPLMKLNKLASVKLVLASGGMKVPYLPQATVTKLIDHALLRIARDKPAWM